MPSLTAHDATEPPDLPPHDSDSELELDIQELDPISISTSSGRPSKFRASATSTTEIDLRNLRMGGASRASTRASPLEDVGSIQGEGEGDSGTLPEQDDFRKPWSLRNSNGDDSVPLLAGEIEPQRRRGSRSSPRLGFMSSAGNDEADDALDKEDDPSSSRFITVGSTQTKRYPPNIISNAKYTAFTFLPLTLYNEFSFFFNMYFLLVALSQAIPALRIGYLSTYIAPLAFVLCITMGKEAYDDIGRWKRDNNANSERYTVLLFSKPSLPSKTQRPKHSQNSGNPKPRVRASQLRQSGLSDISEEDGREVAAGPSSSIQEIQRKSKDLRVGDVLRLSKGQRVPADVVILQCNATESLTAAATGEPSPTHTGSHDGLSALVIKDKGDACETTVSDANEEVDAGLSGETFIRTDQLDGETDWKLRLAPPLTQVLPPEEFVRVRVTGGKPDKKVNEFAGIVELLGSQREAATLSSGPSFEEGRLKSTALSIDNTAWANTIVASQGSTLAVIVYTGPQTRSALSTAPPRSKTGLLEFEINSLTKILCALTLSLSIILVALEGFQSTQGNVWYINILRFLVLFSTIVPISLRVNLDLGKSAYSRFIQRDPGISGAVVRTSTIPEDLGRIEYLLSDKTGTLTQNNMEMKKIHVGTVSYANDAMEVSSYVKQGLHVQPTTDLNTQPTLITPSSTYVTAANAGATRKGREIGTHVCDVVLALALCHNVTPTINIEDGKEVTSYQASSPDEIAIVRWTESVGLKLAHRDRKSMVLESTDCQRRTVVHARILEVFPFTSDGKRMGIVLHFQESMGALKDLNQGEIWFFQKGADTVMSSIVVANDWLDEETANMAREGLRTLVIGRKRLSVLQYREFSRQYQEASLAIHGREGAMQKVISAYLENNIELLGVTGVEDKLQRDVKPSFELLRNAGIKIWMLTGDKVETARCVAVSSKLVARGQYIYTVAKLQRKDSAQDHLDFLRSKSDACLLIDGESLHLLLQHFRTEFISVAVRLPTVVACRCSPTQKAEVANLIKAYTHKRVCCIGDGGNDVSMIQAADVGVGIVGKEGHQASLAADFSIEQFCHLVKLLVWHGRNSYKRSAKLAQFVIHRGLIIAVCQTMFSIARNFEPEGLYKDWLLVGYATVYTAAPVLSLVLDKDVDEDLANLYPELYKELKFGRSLSYRTFFVWVLVSIYQGGMIQGLSQVLISVAGSKMVAVSYTVLVLNELIMVAIEITTWHPVMILSILGTFVVFVGSVPFLGDYFDLAFMITWGFYWRVLTIGAISLIPPYAGKLIRRAVKPPSYRKVRNW